MQTTVTISIKINASIIAVVAKFIVVGRINEIANPINVV